MLELLGAFALLTTPEWAAVPSGDNARGGLCLHASAETAARLRGSRVLDGLTDWAVKHGGPDAFADFPVQVGRFNGKGRLLQPRVCTAGQALALFARFGPLVVSDRGGRFSPYGVPVHHATVLYEVTPRVVVLLDTNYVGEAHFLQALTHAQFAERYGGEVLLVLDE